MENRRPPRPNPLGRKPFSERGNDINRPASGYSRGDGSTRRPPSRNSDDRYRPRIDGAPPRRGGPFDGRFRGGPEKPPQRGRFGQKRPLKPTKPEPPKPVITSDKQITDGKFAGKHLSYSDSPYCTPTERKLREIVFKIISRRIKAGRVLDLGAGAGTIGIEALSRGAMAATFVERSSRTCSHLKKNIEAIGVKDGHAEMVEGEIEPFLKQMARRRRCWDIVFYGVRDKSQEAEAFGRLGRGTAIERGGLLLIEHSSDREFPETLGSLRRWRTIANGFSTITFYERK